MQITITFECDATKKNIDLIEGKKNKDGSIDYVSPSIAKSIRDKIFNYKELNIKIKEATPKNNTYDEALKSDPLLLAEQRMLLNQQMDNS
jgi:hypothetical protein|tara:strand:- start:1280 stop:1549 length:270 start_codon:yes stop_codon:yes gene_type:complete